MNSYLIESEDTLSLNNEISKIIKDNDFTNAVINTYDIEETLLENALEDLDTYNFLSEKKVIIIKNIESIKEDLFEKDIEHLFKYIDNPNQDNLLIITSKKLDSRLKFSKKLKTKCKISKIEANPKAFIKQQLKNYKITQDTTNLLEEYCLGDMTKIYNECEKLKNYKIEDKTITKEDIIELVMKKLGDSKDLVFSFTRSLAERDRKASLKKYKELLTYNIEPLSFIGLLAGQIRIIYQVKLLEKRNLRDKEIADILEEKSDYRIKKTREITRMYSEEELLTLMKKLSEIDLKIKTVDTNPNQEIELFIINI